MTKPKTPWRCQRCESLGKISPRATPRSRLCTWCVRELAKAGQRWCNTSKHGATDWASPKASMCRACQRARNHAYRAAHHDELVAYSRAYHQTHRDELIQQSRVYYREHREQLLAQKRVYYQERAEALKIKSRFYRLHRSERSRQKERARHRAKHQIYKHNERVARARRLVALLRGTA